MRSKELKVRGFIEGIEIPIISATITIAPNQPASAAVQIIATDKAHEIKPRSVVHLFFKDLYRDPLSNLTVAGAGIGSSDVSTQTDYSFLEDEQYRLLFCGEIMGYQFSKTPSVRQMTILCADFSIYWDTCWYYSASGLFSPMKANTKFAGASSGFFNHLIYTQGEMVFKDLTTPPSGFPGVQGILGGLVNVLYSIGGVYGNEKKVGGLNPYFSIAELKFHITQQLAVAADDGPAKLLKEKGFGSIWNRSIKGLGKNFTYRMVINALQKYIFYEVMPCPIARYDPPTGIYDPSMQNSVMLRDHPKYSYLIVAADQLRKSADRLIRDFESEERALTLEEYRSSLRNMRQEMKELSKQAADFEVQKYPKYMTLGRKQAKIALDELAGGPKLPKKGKRYNAIKKALNNVSDNMRVTDGLTVPGVKKNSSEHKPAFLKSQLFRPDVWFCAPPRCNVLFPDQYFQISFNRNYMAEITRLLLRTHLGLGADAILFDKYYYAPATPGIGTDDKLIEKTKKELITTRRDLLDHELYTGVLPQFERAGSHKVFGLRTGSALGGGQKGYAQRLANFLFFKYRYAARQMQVVCPFNPYLAPGFPVAVLDKPLDDEAVSEVRKTLNKNDGSVSSIKGMTGTHYLGLIVGMVHTLNQNGGITQLQMQYARTHNEQVELLGSDIVANVKKKNVGTQPKKSYVASLDAPVKGQTGLYGGVITAVKEIEEGTKFTVGEITKITGEAVKKSKTGKSFNKKFVMEFPLLGTLVKGKSKKKTWKKKFDTLVPVWQELPVIEYGPEVVGLVNTTNPYQDTAYFRLYYIEEDVVRTEEETIDLPLEETVRPSWYSTIWLNRKIGGAVYRDFFGTTAITDPFAVLDEGESASVPKTELAEEGAAQSNITTDEDYQTDLNVINDLDQSASVENAVDYLAYIYSVISKGSYNIDDFIGSYTWRPVATITDMFGSRDLVFEETNNYEEGYVEAVQGIEGFHSRAFGDYKNLFGLLPRSIGKVIGIDSGTDEAAKRLDVRRERWLRVKAYVDELQNRALRG